MVHPPNKRDSCLGTIQELQRLVTEDKKQKQKKSGSHVFEWSCSYISTWPFLL